MGALAVGSHAGVADGAGKTLEVNCRKTFMNRRWAGTIFLQVARGAGGGDDAVIGTIMVAIDALHAAHQMDVTLDCVRGHILLRDGVTGEAAFVLRFADGKETAAFGVEFIMIIRNIFGNAEEMVFGVFIAIRIPRGF